MRASWLMLLVAGLHVGPAWAQDADVSDDVETDELDGLEDAGGDDAASDDASDADAPDDMDVDGADDAMDDADDAMDDADDAMDDEFVMEEADEEVEEALDDADDMTDAEVAEEAAEDMEEVVEEVAEKRTVSPAGGQTLDGEPLMHDGEAPPNEGTERQEIYGEATAANEGRTYTRGEEVSPYAELRVKKKVLPDYPVELQVLYGEQAVRCEGVVSVDAKGSPNWVALDDCPDGFHLAAIEAIRKWKWAAPTGYVPAEGVKVRVRTGFERKNKGFYPGVTYFRSPDEVTADPTLPVLIKQGKMPKYPRYVSAGDDICLIQLTVDARGNTRDVIIDECAKPYRKELAKAVKSWKWWWTSEPDKDETHTLVTEVVFRL